MSSKHVFLGNMDVCQRSVLPNGMNQFWICKSNAAPGPQTGLSAFVWTLSVLKSVLGASACSVCYLSWTAANSSGSRTFTRWVSMRKCQTSHRKAGYLLFGCSILGPEGLTRDYRTAAGDGKTVTSLVQKTYAQMIDSVPTGNPMLLPSHPPQNPKGAKGWDNVLDEFLSGDFWAKEIDDRRLVQAGNLRSMGMLTYPFWLFHFCPAVNEDVRTRCKSCKRGRKGRRELIC